MTKHRMRFRATTKNYGERAILPLITRNRWRGGQEQGSGQRQFTRARECLLLTIHITVLEEFPSGKLLYLSICLFRRVIDSWNQPSQEEAYRRKRNP